MSYLGFSRINIQPGISFPSSLLPLLPQEVILLSADNKNNPAFKLGLEDFTGGAHGVAELGQEEGLDSVSEC